MDVVEMGVGERNRPHPVRRDIRFAQGLGKQPHARVPGVRRARVDQRHFRAIVDCKGVDRKPELTTDKLNLGGQVVPKDFVPRLTKAGSRHIDMTIAEGGEDKATKPVRSVQRCPAVMRSVTALT